MDKQKKPMACLPLVGIFILVGMCGIALLFSFTQQRDDATKQPVPEPNWQVKTIRKPIENNNRGRTYAPPPKTPSRQIVAKPPAKPPNDINKFVWWDTPKDQELKVGNWIKVIGWQRTFIGATWDTQTNNLKYSGELGYLTLTPTENGAHFPSHEIIGIFSEVNISYNNEDIVNINNNLLKAKNASHWGSGTKVRLTAKISAINSDSRYPDKRFLMCSDAHVIYYPY